MTTGQRIKAARKKAGVTQEELGKKLGVSPSFVAQYETGKRNPKIETLQNLANALGVPVYELIDSDDLKRAVIYGEGLDDDSSGGPPNVVLHEEPIDKTEVEVHEITAEELETLMAKLQDGKPLLLSPDDLAKLKATPKEQVAAALDKQEERGEIKQIRAPIFKMGAKRPDIHTRYEHSLGVTHLASELYRIAAALDKLNKEGQEKVATYAEDLVEMPKYQAQEPPTTPAQSTPMPQDGTDTAPAETPPDGPQEPPEGRIQSITMICPICGQHLRGDTSTGKAYCNYCKRSFPLPQILK